MMSRPSLGPSRLSNAADAFSLKLPRQSLAGPPTASRVSFGGNMAGTMMNKKPAMAASRYLTDNKCASSIAHLLTS